MRSITVRRVVVSCAGLFAAAALAAPLTPVPDANNKVVGQSAPNGLSPELTEAVVAEGSNRLENPAAVTLPSGGTVSLPYYGYNGDGPFVPAFGSNVEATKTEPDKNTYLVVHGQHGADPHYDYGHHFLYQGHEIGKAGMITRINLDADEEHRVTLLASTLADGTPLPTIDGSTWNPFARRLLFTTESGSNASVMQATLDFPSTVEDISGALGRGGYEGIQTDPEGNLWIVEDIGGKNGTANPHAKQPNSFLYRFVPRHRSDLTRGRLQVLQVISLRTGTPIVFHASDIDGDIKSNDILDLHTYGKVFQTRWITIHDTDKDGSKPFDANAVAKAAGGTPFKRPENGQFRPGTGFREFFFSETGDTSALTEAGSAFGGFGGVFKLSQDFPGDDEGRLRPFYVSDVFHTGFDNVAFWDANHVVVVEDAGDTLHTQRNALDSGYLFDVRKSYADPRRQPIRILALGRDASATIDSGLSGTAGFQNEGDNEITGIHVSNGDPTATGLLGAAIPRPFQDGWRVFYTQQHGDNRTWEILPANPKHFGDDDRVCGDD